VEETLLLTLCNWSLPGAKRAQSPFCTIRRGGQEFAVVAQIWALGVGFSSILSGQVAAGMVQGTACRGAAAGQLNHDVTHLQGQRIEGALAQVRGV
jgi:hypothetical protein